MTNLSEHFTLEELTASEAAERLSIDNTPSDNIKKILKETAANMELVREVLGEEPIHINSGYRSPTLNRFIGGSSTSAHKTGYAVDFKCPGFGTPEQITRCIQLSGIKYDQLIYEGSWVHISFAPEMRQQTLTATFNKGKASYSTFI